MFSADAEGLTGLKLSIIKPVNLHVPALTKHGIQEIHKAPTSSDAPHSPQKDLN